jgi:enterochelin esterase-like enzyme
VEYTWSMRHWQGRLLCFSILIALFLPGCSSVDGEDLIVNAVGSVQAVIIQSDPVRADDPLGERSCSDEAEEDTCLTQPAVEVQRPTESFKDRCGQVEGSIEQKSYPGMISGDLIPVIIYLPPCYDPYLQVYPVLFLLHGKPQDERHWLLLGVDEIFEQGLQEGKWPAFVMVMPQQPEPLFSQSDGGPGSLEQELLQGLVPFILDRYAITGDGERWGIAGISRGGVWALEISFQHADQFQAVAALSPALNVNSARASFDPMLMLPVATPAPATIFLGAGETDSARAMTQMLAETTDELDLRYQYLEVPGNHESATWIKLIPDMLAFITSNW